MKSRGMIIYSSPLTFVLYNDRLKQVYPNMCQSMQYVIKDIRRGRGNRSHIIYAGLYNDKNERIIAATLDYISERLKELIPTQER